MHRRRSEGGGRGVVEGEFFQVRAGSMEHEFPGGQAYQLQESDAVQDVYGLPERVPAVQAALLNESAATLFRRECYTNGSHAGFILYQTDPKPNRRTLPGCAKRSRQ